MRTTQLKSHPVRAVTVAAVSALGLALVPGTAQADLGFSVTSTDTLSVPATGSTALTGLTVVPDEPADLLQVTVSTDVGTLSFSATDGLTAAFGNDFEQEQSITFTATAEDANTGLGSVTIEPGESNAGETATVKLSALVDRPGYVYSPTNEHFYEFVAAEGITWTQAEGGAATRFFGGQQGYLATVPNAQVNELIASKIEGAQSVWLGARGEATYDDMTEVGSRAWRWATGPLAGQVFTRCTTYNGDCAPEASTVYSNWAPDEPNNAGGEDAMVTNWGKAGEWNDLDSGQIDGGYIVEYGDQVVGSAGFSGVAKDSSTVSIEALPEPVSVPEAPDGVSVRPGDRTLSISWDSSKHLRSSEVPSYEVSIDGGRHWKRVQPTDSKDGMSTVVGGVRNGQSYSVQVRALNTAGASEPSLAASTKTTQWFRDPLSAAVRRTHVAVPAKPTRYRGPVRNTVATAQAQGGGAAMAAGDLGGRHLQSGQAVGFGPRPMFAYNSTVLSKQGRASVKSLVRSLTWVDAVTCDGYADFGGRKARESRLAKKRAAVVCKALRSYGADVTTTVRGHGSSVPVVIGGDRGDRSANRRVLVRITQG